MTRLERSTLVVILPLALLGSPAVAGDKGRVPTIDDLLTIKTVAWSGVALSPDGKWVAYLVRQADFKADKSLAKRGLQRIADTQTVPAP
jgi:hypothetical protein